MNNRFIYKLHVKDFIVQYFQCTCKLHVEDFIEQYFKCTCKLHVEDFIVQYFQKWRLRHLVVKIFLFYFLYVRK